MKPQTLKLPLKHILATQPFGVNYLDFYQKLKMKGHNGVDFKARRKCPVYAAHDGEVTRVPYSPNGGNFVEIIADRKGDSFKTVYFHLLEQYVKAGNRVKAGDLIGYADNTGKMTTGNHLHFGLKETYNGEVKNHNNGYFGAIDPAPYFKKNWDKSRAYHRYGRKQEWYAEFKMRFLNPWLHRQLIKRGQLSKVFNTEFINALVYGGWDYENVINPAMRENWAYLKKDEFLGGKRPFI